MFDLSAEIQRVESDISRTTSEKEKIARSLTENTTKTNEQIAKLAASIASLQTSRQRLQDFMGFDQKLSELNALKAEHALCTTTINGLNGTITTRTTERDAALASVATLNTTLATRDNTIAVLNGTIEARDLAIVDLNQQNTNLQAQIEALLGQLPGETFLTFDEARAGNLSSFGLQDILVIYESAMVKPATAATAAPDAAWLDTAFANIKAANPTVNRVVLDYETWALVSSGVVNTTAVGWYVTLINAAKAHFSDVGLYGEIPERYYLYLNYPPGHATHISRKNGWFSRAAQMQPIWDAVNSVYPSVYYLNPVHTDAADRDLWYTDIAAMCAQFAPGKKVIPFFWPRVHPSEDPTKPWINGDYWLASLTKAHELFDGYVLWLESEEPDLSTISPEPLWWTRTKEFQAAL
jgi:predicted  nucleic acid-binding Zn-ribbon protein